MMLVETISTIYKELFTVQLQHTGFPAAGSGIFSAISIKPDSETAQIFRRYHLDYKCYNNALLCFARSVKMNPPAKEPKAPFVVIDPVLKLRFLIQVQPAFFSKTFSTVAGSTVVYYFTNQTTHIQGDKKYLQQPVPVHQPANDYWDGAIVQHNGEHFVSILPIPAADGISINNTAYWFKAATTNPAANNADLSPVATVLPEEKCWGVIDVFLSGTDAHYALLGAGGQVLSPVYTISFKSKI